jgi:hypothetical protein
MDEPGGQIGEDRAGLPAVVTPVYRQPVRGTASAPFVSQLLASRARLDTQKARRRAPVDTAVDAYANGARISVRRMPQGFRKTLVV